MQALPFCSALLNCGYLDLQYLINLTEAYNLDPTELMLEAREFRLWMPQINDFIYVALIQVAERFVSELPKRVSRKDSCLEYSIFTNCMDSHIWFEDEGINNRFEKWRKA